MRSNHSAQNRIVFRHPRAGGVPVERFYFQRVETQHGCYDTDPRLRGDEEDGAGLLQLDC